MVAADEIPRRGFGLKLNPGPPPKVAFQNAINAVPINPHTIYQVAGARRYRMDMRQRKLFLERVQIRHLTCCPADRR